MLQGESREEGGEMYDKGIGDVMVVEYPGARLGLGREDKGWKKEEGGIGERRGRIPLEDCTNTLDAGEEGDERVAKKVRPRDSGRGEQGNMAKARQGLMKI